MNTEELKRLAEAATPGPWEVRAGVLRKIGEQPQIATIYRPYNSQFIAAANPATVLELIRQRDELLARNGVLREENERQRFDILAMNQSLEMIREENERLRKDAERYRWLSDDGGIHSLPYDDFGCGPVFDLSRDAIDAARGAK